MMYRPDSPPGILIIDTTDKFGKRIILEKDRFEDHIIGTSGHVELKDHVEAIVDTIKDPTWIVESKKFENIYLYIGKSAKSMYPKLDIKTVVNQSSESFGFIVTSMIQKGVNPGKEGDIIYDKTKDPGKSR